MTALQAFYSSKKWKKFVECLKIERTSPDGNLYCEHCGKPIVRQYDCIGHHVVELTEDNVNDPEIAYNPDNIKLIHFRCHNELHERFGYRGSIIKQVFIVYGAPCSGKSTWVDSVASRDDLILNIDRLWNAVKASACDSREKPDALKAVVFDIRDCILQDIRTRRGKWRNAYIIGGYPMSAERERIADMVGADKQIFIDTPKDVCLQRAADISETLCGFVSDWFDKTDGNPPVGEKF